MTHARLAAHLQTGCEVHLPADRRRT